MATNLRNLAQGRMCQLRIPGICNRDPSTTVLAHLRIFGAAGMGQKPPDLVGVHACSSCHDALDGRTDPQGKIWPKENRQEDILRALVRTLVVVSRDQALR